MEELQQSYLCVRLLSLPPLHSLPILRAKDQSSFCISMGI